MTLGRLVTAWLIVVIWFVAATFATGYLIAKWRLPPPMGAAPTAARLRVLKWRLVESGLLTLLASLWFDSLGSGGWWLMFLLMGGLATAPRWVISRPDPVPQRVILAGALSDVLRYVTAGALLAWRLS